MDCESTQLSVARWKLRVAQRHRRQAEENLWAAQEYVFALEAEEKAHENHT